VESGSVTFDSPNANTLNIVSTTDQAIINWQSFNIAQNETVNFTQPSALSAILNRVVGGGGASSIAGALNSNGTIVLVNPAGVSIAQTANINVGAFNSSQAASFIASSLNISNNDFRAGNYVFQKEGMLSAAVINQGMITVKGGGLVMLFGGSVENSGTINAHAGKVVLASGDKITVNFTQNGLISVAVDEQVVGGVVTADGTTVKDAVKNIGSINADGGQVILTAEAVSGIFDKAVNNEGIIKANTVIERNGVIELVSSTGTTVNKGVVQAKGTAAAPNGGTVKVTGKMAVNDGMIDVSADNGGTAGKVTVMSGTGGTLLMPNSLIDASGHEIMSNAGEVLINSLGNTIFAPDAKIDISGGLVSGDAGFAEVSAHQNLGFYGYVDGFSQAGYKRGAVLLDPYNVTISFAGDFNIDPVTLQPTGDNAVISVPSLQAALLFNDVSITTDTGGIQSGWIRIDDPIVWGSPTDLTLMANSDIIVNGAIQGGGSLSLTAGMSGAGNIETTQSITMVNDIIMNAAAGVITLGGDVAATTGYIEMNAQIGIDVGGSTLSAAGVDAEGRNILMTLSGGAPVTVTNFGVIDAASLIRIWAQAGNLTVDTMNAEGAIWLVATQGGGGVTLNGGLESFGGYVMIENDSTFDMQFNNINGMGDDGSGNGIVINFGNALGGTMSNIGGFTTINQTRVSNGGNGGTLSIEGDMTASGGIYLAATGDLGSVQLGGDLTSMDSYVTIETDSGLNGGGFSITGAGPALNPDGRNIDISFSNPGGGMLDNVQVLNGTTLTRIWSDGELQITSPFIASGAVEAESANGMVWLSGIQAGGPITINAATAIDGGGADISTDSGAFDITLFVNDGSITALGTLTGDTVTLGVLGGAGAGLEVAGNVTANAGTQLEILAGGGSTLTLTNATIQNNLGHVVVTSEGETITGQGPTSITSVGGNVSIESDFNGDDDLTVSSWAADVIGAYPTNLTTTGVINLTAAGAVRGFGNISGDGGVALNSMGGDLFEFGSITSSAGNINLTSAGNISSLGLVNAWGYVSMIPNGGIDTVAGITAGGNEVTGLSYAILLNSTAGGISNLGPVLADMNDITINTGAPGSDLDTIFSVDATAGAIELGSSGNMTGVGPVTASGNVGMMAGFAGSTITLGGAVTSGGTAEITAFTLLDVNGRTVSGTDGVTLTVSNPLGGTISNLAEMSTAPGNTVELKSEFMIGGLPPIVVPADLTLSGALVVTQGDCEISGRDVTGVGLPSFTVDNGSFIIEAVGGAISGLGVIQASDEVALLSLNDMTITDPVKSTGSGVVMGSLAGSVVVTGDVTAGGIAVPPAPFPAIPVSVGMSAGNIISLGNTIDAAGDVIFANEVNLLSPVTITTNGAGDIIFADDVEGAGVNLNVTALDNDVTFAGVVGGAANLGVITGWGVNLNALPADVHDAATWWNGAPWPVVPPVPGGGSSVLSSGPDAAIIIGIGVDQTNKDLTSVLSGPAPVLPGPADIRLGPDPFMPNVRYNVMHIDLISYTLQPPSEVQRLAYNISQYEGILRGLEIGNEIKAPAQEPVTFEMMNPLVPAMGTFVNLGNGIGSMLGGKNKE